MIVFPFFSTWRGGNEALNQLPVMAGEPHSDRQHRFGSLFDDQMILARRIYPGLPAEDVTLALRQSGFESYRTVDHTWQVKECCGEWDGVLARAEDRTDGGSVVLLSMVDGDLQSVWPIFLVIGLPLMTAGAGFVLAGVDRRETNAEQPLTSV